MTTQSGEFRDRHAAEHLQVLDGMLPEITRDRIGEDAIPAVSELAGAAQANFKEIIGGYAQTIETEAEERLRAVVKSTAAKIAAIPVEEENVDNDEQEQSRA